MSRSRRRASAHITAAETGDYTGSISAARGGESTELREPADLRLDREDTEAVERMTASPLAAVIGPPEATPAPPPPAPGFRPTAGSGNVGTAYQGAPGASLQNASANVGVNGHVTAEFEVPGENCGGQWLTLRIPARIPAEGRIGGNAWFDDLKIVRIP